MISSVAEYLNELKKEMAGSDRATTQDAMTDAEEYLRSDLAQARETNPDVSEASAMPSIIEAYGNPAEIAAAYKKVEGRLPVAHARPQSPRSLLGRFFGVMIDPRAWSTLFYFLLTLATGIIYFTWAVTGLSLSLGLLVLIIGLPIAALFLLSVHGIALIEGRLVEALLGVRMPRRAAFTEKSPGLWKRLKKLLTDRYTWLSLAYEVLLLPLGIFYFTLFITLLAVAFLIIAQPVLEYGFNQPLFTYNYAYYVPIWLMPFVVVGGVLLLVLIMHLVRATGRLHGRLAKAMLVRQ